MPLGAIILAAGASRRMGRAKMLLPWAGTTIIGHLIGVWRELGAAPVVVVCRAGDEALQWELDRLGIPTDHRIVNPAPERGMFSSIQCASAWAGWGTQVTDMAVILGDQPHLAAETLQRLIDFKASHPEAICQLEYAG